MSYDQQRRIPVDLRPTGTLEKCFNPRSSNGSKQISKYGPPLDQYIPKSTPNYHIFKVLADSPNKRTELALVNGKSFILIGRSDSADIKISSPYDELVSKEHCVFQFRSIEENEGFKLYILDMKSTNGTWLNGNEIPYKRYVELKHGDRIRLGEWDFLDEDTNERVYEGIEFIIVTE